MGPPAPRVCVCVCLYVRARGEIRPLSESSRFYLCDPRLCLTVTVRVFKEALILSSPPLCLHSGLGTHTRQHATRKLFCQAHPIKKEWKSRMEKKKKVKRVRIGTQVRRILRAEN